MCGGIAYESTGEEDSDPPGDNNASEHADGDTEAAGDENTIEQHKNREFSEGEGGGLEEGAGVEGLLLPIKREYSSMRNRRKRLYDLLNSYDVARRQCYKMPAPFREVCSYSQGFNSHIQ